MLSADLTTKARNHGVRKSIDFDGMECVYYEYPASGSNNETIVMIHGYRGNHRGLEAIAGGLANYRVIIPDLPGFGESQQFATKHDLDTYATWLRVLLENLGVANSAYLVGHSFGTLVVGTYATKNRCKGVVLINPVSAPALSGPQAFLTRITSLFYHFSASLPENAGSWLLRHPAAVLVMSSVMAKTKDRKLRSWIHKQHLANFSDFASVAVAIEGYEASISSNLSAMAPKIQSPVLLVAATLDDITNIDIQRGVVNRFPNANLVEIDGVGHLVHYEAPLQAANQISLFIENQK
jgi:pimeloyl-ACP methyl ester carboxylesterase